MSGKLFTEQMAFAAHLRDPNVHPAPNEIEDRRLQIYRDLFYNNVEGFVANGFPVLKSLLDDTSWHQLVRRFFRDYRCKTPYFIEIAEEFLNFLQTEQQPLHQQFPFLVELAHYEWVELAVDTSMEQIPTLGFNPNGDMLQGHPLLSPLAHVLTYEYPVHQIKPGFVPLEKSAAPHFLLVYRNLDDRVKFMEINAATAQLMGILTADPNLTGLQAVQQMAQLMPQVDLETLTRGARTALEHLRQVGVVLGTELRPIATE